MASQNKLLDRNLEFSLIEDYSKTNDCMQPSTIKIFLVNGSPTGLRTAEISNWSGKAIACSRNQLRDLLQREECSNPGVYVLSGIDAETGDDVVYVGEAEQVGKRIQSHKEKDYWNSSVFFVSKDENLTKAHVRYLEGKLISKAIDAGKSKVMNSQSGGSRLPESDAAEMDIFFENIIRLLPILGIGAFHQPEGEKTETSNLYYCKIKGLSARGRRTANGFMVLEGSEAVLRHRPSARWTKRLREDLVAKGVLEESGDKYVFSKNYEFGSPSTAGAAVRGGATNGLTAWRNKAGKSIRDLELDL